MHDDITNNNGNIEFITQDVPTQTRGGPRTQLGKSISRYNALKGGLYCSGILPCLSNCFYIDTCPFNKDMHNNGPGEKIELCVIEAALYIKLHAYFQSNQYFNELDEALVEDIIMLRIQLERTSRYIMIHPDIIGDNNDINAAYIHYLRLHKRFLKHVNAIIKYKNIINNKFMEVNIHE